jgi:hypothetical protein
VPAAAKARHAEAQPAQHEQQDKEPAEVVKARATRWRANRDRPPGRAGRVPRDGLRLDSVHGSQS